MFSQTAGCIYIATNTVNGRQYVGKTGVSLDRRRKRHFQDAKNGSDVPFHRAIRKHGESAFDFKIVVVGPDDDWLNDTETSIIAALGTFGNGYNATTGGEGVRGLVRNPWSQESREKLSASQKLVWKDRDSPWKGRTHTQESREKIGNAKRGKTLSDEHRANLSESHKGKHHAGTFKLGYTHPEETKRLMSETRKGIPKTGKGLENIRRGCAARKGVKRPEAGAKLSAAILAMPLVKCPHCETRGRARGGMFRYHFDNCKYALISDLV